MKPFAFVCAALSSRSVKLSLIFALTGISMFGSAMSFAQTPPPVYPEVRSL